MSWAKLGKAIDDVAGRIDKLGRKTKDVETSLGDLGKVSAKASSDVEKNLGEVAGNVKKRQSDVMDFVKKIQEGDFAGYIDGIIRDEKRLLDLQHGPKTPETILKEKQLQDSIDMFKDIIQTFAGEAGRGMSFRWSALFQQIRDEWEQERKGGKKATEPKTTGKASATSGAGSSSIEVDLMADIKRGRL